MQAVEGRSANQQTGNGINNTPSSFSYRLVRNAIYSVTGAFILVMGLFAYLQVFNTENSANVTAALSSLFGIVGTLVGAYFGIKASSDAQDRSADTARSAVADQRETAKQAVADQRETAMQAVTHQKETAQQAVTVAAASQTGPEASGVSARMLALAALIPIGGTAGLLVLRRYFGRT